MATYKGDSMKIGLVVAALALTAIQVGCRSVAKIKTEYAESYCNQGVSKFNLEDYRGAIEDYTKAIENYPKYVKAYIWRGNAKQKLGDYQGAIEDYTKTIDLAPKYSSPYYSRGDAKVNLGEYEGAIKDYTKAIELEPYNASAYRTRGLAKFHLGDNPGAVKDYTKAIELAGGDAFSYRLRGLAKSRWGDNQGAIQDLRTAQRLGDIYAWELIKSVQSNNQGASQRHTTYIAPPRAKKEFVVTHFDYDDATKKGVISVRTYSRGIECRDWLVKNIGAISSSKNITLKAGEESKKGGRYRILDEKIENDILTVHFEAAW